MSERTIVRVTPRLGTTRCAYCHGPLADADGVTCSDCATRLHVDCVEARCPTLGCPRGSSFAPRVAVSPLTIEWSARRSTAPSLSVVVLPIFAIISNELGFFTSTDVVVPNWRGPGPEGWAWLFQARAAEAQRLFYPLLLWSMFAHAAASEGKRGAWIRVGLSGGVLLTAAFSALYLPLLPLSAVLIFAFGLGFLGLAPFIAFVSYVKARLRYGRERRVADGAEAPGFVPWTVWTLFTGAATAFAIERMNARWATLPDQNPNCFIATAAARGHARVVGSQPVRFANGRTVAVTRQLRALKAAELALAAFTPGLHRAMRAVYDRLGPSLAARMGRTTGTLAWILLLPAQALAELGLRVVFRGAGRLISLTYTTAGALGSVPSDRDPLEPLERRR